MDVVLWLLLFGALLAAGSVVISWVWPVDEEEEVRRWLEEFRTPQQERIQILEHSVFEGPFPWHVRCARCDPTRPGYFYVLGKRHYYEEERR